MNIAQLQRAIGTRPDGLWGPASKHALLTTFTNRTAPAVTAKDLAAAAYRLGCSILQLQAVREVESDGTGFDAAGRPKILWERHRFHRQTGGRFSPSEFSQSTMGGYTYDANKDGVVDSWDRLSAAIATGFVDVAFQSCSWGAFQIMGDWWDELKYASPFDMAISTRVSEAAHLDMLVRFIEHNGLQDEIRALTSNPATCRAFAAAYNGPAFRKNRYDEKLAAVMAGRA